MNTKDGRKKLRANYPARISRNIVALVSAEQYNRLYRDAMCNRRSLQDEIRYRLFRREEN